MMTNKLPAEAVIDQPGVAMRTGEAIAAGAAERQRRVAAAIEEEQRLFAALERAIVHSIPKPIALVVCYPANPTAYVASLDFYRDLVPFAKKHGIFILSDLAYAEVYFDDNPPPSPSS